VDVDFIFDQIVEHVLSDHIIIQEKQEIDETDSIIYAFADIDK